MTEKNRMLLKAYKLGFRVSKDGKTLTTVYRKLEQRVCEPNGYPRFSIKNEKSKVISIPWHRLQAYQKYGDSIFEEGIVVRHLNSIKTDCSWDNILIGTATDNARDKPAEERLKYSLIASDKWRKHSATEIRNFYESCKSYRKTMQEFSISSKGTLHYILNKAKWS